MDVSIVISLLAFVVSGITFWLTRLKNGSVKMTRPTVIFFGPDGGPGNHYKVYIRTLLYCSADKGKYLQNMFIRLQRGESIQNFNVWVYRDKDLVRGSGLFVDKRGVSYDHHFLLPKDQLNYFFLQGEYLLEVFIEPVNEKPKMIFQERLILTKEQSEDMKNSHSGLYFDWAPNTQNYYSHIDVKKIV